MPINSKLLRQKLSDWKEILFISLATKLYLLIFSYITLFPKNIFSPWAQWDFVWYRDIALNWYHLYQPYNNSIAFYPLYPLLIRIFDAFIQNITVSAVVIPFLFSFLAAILLFELVLIDFDKKVATLSVWFLCIYPTAYFLQSSYTESLFLTFTLSSLYFFRTSQYKYASLGGLLSSLTRFNGLLLLPVLLIENKDIKKTLVTLMISCLGFLIFLAINLSIFGDPFHFQKALLSEWSKKLDWPWVGIINGIGFMRTYSDQVFITYVFEYIALIFITIMTIYTFIKIRASYGVYMLLHLLLFTSTSFILSTPRYSLILFPIFIAMAKLSNNKGFLYLQSFISVSLLIYFTNEFINGRWAF